MVRSASPDSSLMVGRVARARSPKYLACNRDDPAQGPQSEGSQQLLFRQLQDRSPARRVEHRVIQRKRENLIGPARRVVSVRAVDYVVEMAEFLLPETPVERICARSACVRHLIGALLPRGSKPGFQKPQRVVPEPVDLHRFPAARRHHPVAHLGIHPGELIAFFSLRKESIRWIDVDTETRSSKWWSAISSRFGSNNASVS